MHAGLFTGTKHGNGVYFARDASYSNNYARDCFVETRTMYRAQVLIGRYTKSQRDMKCPPEIPGHDARFNSVVDNLYSPSIYVIFFDDQVYPGHIITYTETESR